MDGAAATSTSGPDCKCTVEMDAPMTRTLYASAVQRLLKAGVPAEEIAKGPSGLVDFVNRDRTRLPEAVSILFPDVDDVKDVALDDVGQGGDEILGSMCENAVSWVQWLLFGGDPKASISEIGIVNGGQRGVCGAVWGSDDIAYRCRTCENDPTCAICVPCFHAGDHRNHDYCMIRTCGGCCDCGDATAWKKKGFCSEHRGPGFVPSLSTAFLFTAGPVLAAVLRVWASKLNAPTADGEGKPKKSIFENPKGKLASHTSVAIIDMLLHFCNTSESMLSFTAKYVGMRSLGVLDAVLRTEAFLQEKKVERLHVLLYKLLGDTDFKCSFAQEFICHYPKFMRDSTQDEMAVPDSDVHLTKADHAILGSFSVQIFTVPTLTPKLVVESGLLDMLLGSLKELFLACMGDDGRILVSKSRLLSRLYRVCEDIRYVMSHLEVAQYVASKRPELPKAWLEAVAFVEGIYPQRRAYDNHVEEENDDWDGPFSLEMQMAPINHLYCTGAASVSANEPMEAMEDDSSLDWKLLDDDASIVRHAKLGRITKETEGMDAGGANGLDIEMDDVTNASCAGGKESKPSESSSRWRNRDATGALACSVPAPLLWLLAESLSFLDKWLAVDSARELAKGHGQGSARTSNLLLRSRLLGGRTRNITSAGRATAMLVDPGEGGATRTLVAAPGQMPVLNPPLAGTQATVPGQATNASPPPNGTLDPAPPEAPAQATRPTRAAAAPADGTAGRSSALREWWLRRQRRPFTAERAGLHDERVSLSSGAGTSSRDVDAMTRIEPERTGDNAGREWWMGADVSGGAPTTLQLSSDDWPSVKFDVSRQDVSFHIPLHRMVAILLRKTLESSSSNSEASSSGVSQTSFLPLQHFLPEKFRLPAFASFMMEHPLRLQVLSAQVQAGMWRRNGRIINKLCELYRTVPWCEDSLELDLLVLQCCAALAPPEKFVDRIQTRFGLADYFTLHLKQSPSEYDPILAQEFLVLLIKICVERGFCGLAPEDVLRRELIQRLAVGDSTHSSLLRALPHCLRDSTHLSDCLNSVAVYRNPSGLQQGKFSLRKECWRELDLYHPRWSPRELQAAEDRYSRACKTSPVFTQLPSWKEPFSPLKLMGRFVVTAKVHDILCSVFFHAVYSPHLSNSREPEGLVFVALHLLALALSVCSYLDPSKKNRDEDLGQKSFAQDMSAYGIPPHHLLGLTSTNGSNGFVAEIPILARATERVSVQTARGEQQQSLLSLLVLLMRKYGSDKAQQGIDSDSNEQNAGDVIKVLLRKFADLDRGCMYEVEFLAPEILHRPTISGSPAVGNSGIDSSKKTASTDEDRRRTIARQRQQAIMAKMKADQDRFLASLQGGPSENKGEQGADANHQQQMDEDTDEESMTPTCALCRDSGFASPLCFLTLVQKSRILAFAQNPPPTWEDPVPPSLDLCGRKSRRTASMLGRNDIRMFPTEEFTEFLTPMPDPGPGGPALWDAVRHGFHPGVRNVVLVANALGISVRGGPQAEGDIVEEENGEDVSEVDNGRHEGQSVYGANWWKGTVVTSSQEGKREAGQITVLAEYFSAICRGRRQPREPHQPRTVEARALELETGQEGGTAVRTRRPTGRNILDATVNTGIGITDTAGVHLSACGHAVHQECLDRYLSTLLDRFYGRTLFEGVQIVDPDMGEYLCPVCRRLSNSAIPVPTEGPGAKVPSRSEGSAAKSLHLLSSGECEPISDSNSANCKNSEGIWLNQSLSVLSRAEEIVCEPGYRNSASTSVPDYIKGTLETLALRVHGLLIPDREYLGGVNGRISQTLHLWDVLRYSLMSAELATRAHQEPSCSRRSLRGLTRLEEAVDAKKGSVIPLLLQASQLIQAQSRQVVLLRARGMQLCADSISNGISRDIFSENSDQGNVSSLLQYLEQDPDAPDVQFWKRMTDPVVLRDPISSLLWLLFCLPLQLPSGDGPFTSLVHLFYLICLTQILAYAGAAIVPHLEAGPSVSSFVATIQKSLHGRVFDSRNECFSLSDGSATSLLRRVTLPFLRQCYMLQKLLSGSTEVLPVPSTHAWELSQRSMASGFQQSGKSSEAAVGQIEEEISVIESEELDALEKFFSIPPLNVWLSDGEAQRSMLKWCQHVSGDAGILTLGNVPRPVRAIPFKLMRLPHLFQDLLRRYNKETCLRCNTVPDRPALCLFCGTLCCDFAPHSSCGCSLGKQSECYKHAMACGAGVGVFLLLRKTNILLQRCERRSAWPSPYLDCYGEEDHEGRLKPLFLSEERYAALTSMVAWHGLDYSSLVLALTSREML